MLAISLVATPVRAADQPFKASPIIETSAPAEVKDIMVPIIAAGLGADLRNRVAALRKIQETWLADWQSGKLTSATLREHRYFSDRMLIDAVVQLPASDREGIEPIYLPFLAEAIDWCDGFNDPSIGFNLFSRSLGIIGGDTSIAQPQFLGILRKISTMIEALPQLAVRQRTLANMAVAMGMVSAFTSLNAETIALTARAARNTLALDDKAQDPLLSPNDKKTMASLLLMATVFMPGTERIELNHFAKDHGGVILTSQNKSAGYFGAVDAALSGDWIEADRLMETAIDNPQVMKETLPGSSPAQAPIISIMFSKQMLMSEAAAVKVKTGHSEAAMHLFERSRSTALQIRPQADALASELRIILGGETIVQVAAGWMGTFAVVSRPKDGKVARTSLYTANSGGLALISNYVHFDPGQRYVPGGILAAYYLIRTVPRRGPSPALDMFVDDLNRRTESLVGDAIRQALSKAGAKPNERIVLILPATLAMLPVAGSRGADNISLGERYELRFAQSLAHAAGTISSTKGTPGAGIGFLASSSSNLDAVSFEQAAIKPTRAILGAATADEVFKGLDGTDYWHIASHGSSDWGKAKANGIYLDGKALLNDADIRGARIHHPPRLVFLSACETAILDITQDIHRYASLQTAFAAMGAQGVVGTLWPIGDGAAALLSVRFRDYLIDDHIRPASALRRAQLWLRDSDARTLRNFVTNKIALGKVTATQAQGIMASLADFEAGSRPFAHPFYWTAFELLGG
ncbi:CHAT domain-containing protein [Sphingobium sp. AP50]|uniref:CHAT domain-containing protein n=1 Tax=Sphingobium sp. AP50 TaxID=1884369 RepID=UPI0015A5B579|nr:CHAT domain-containing protein [Sphingobium sp. AP50]